MRGVNSRSPRPLLSRRRLRRFPWCFGPPCYRPPGLRLHVAFALLFSVSVRAEPVSALDASQWTHTRVFLTGGAISRGATMRFGEATSTLGAAPRLLGLHLSGAHFTKESFGFSFDARADLIGATSELTGRRIGSQAVKGSVQLALRWQPSLLVGLELHGGFGVGRLAFLRTVGSVSDTEYALLAGPTAMGVFTLEPTTWLSVQLFGRGEFSVVTLSGWAVGGGLQARVRLVEVGPLEVGLAVSAEATLGRHTNSSRSVDDFVWRAGIGPSVQARHGGTTPLAPPTPELPSLVGSVRQEDKASPQGVLPVAGATVVVRNQTVTSDAAGAFSVSGLEAGPATVTVSAPGFKPSTREVVVTPGTPVQVLVTLVPPSGPGSISGVVRASPEKPLAGVKLTAGALGATSDAAGAFTLGPVGPGPVKVKATLEGYAAADEVVQVAPEATTTLELTLEPLAQRSKARIRGVISSAAGPVAKATVRIVELKLKQAVKADGRFEAEVAGGRYTLVIEAPKHVTQTRTVEVADGDQAIFQIELEKAR